MIWKILSLLGILVMIYSIGYYQGLFPSINEITGYFTNILNLGIPISELVENPEKYYNKTINIYGDIVYAGRLNCRYIIKDTKGYDLCLKGDERRIKNIYDQGTAYPVLSSKARVTGRLISNKEFLIEDLQKI